MSARSMTPRVARRKVDQSAYDRGDVSFILLSGFLVLLMIPGLAFLYSGLVRRKNALHIMFACILANAVVVITWYVWGFSLGFSETATNGFIGNLSNAGLRNALEGASTGSPLIPQLLYAFFQMEFACVTVSILVGAVAERGRIAPLLLFSFVWTTLVYCVLTHWVWATGGWAFKWGVMDYAGGGPVEIGSGVGGLAYAVILGRRKEDQLVNFRAHNVSLICLGTFLLWFGWLGFNAGSAFGANLRAVYAAWNSNISAAASGIVWCLLDYRTEGKYTVVGFCSGTIAGLVAATPSSGMVPAWAMLIIGIVSGAVCNYATKLKFYLKVDDSLDLFAEHAIGGIIGLIGNAFFAADYIISLDDVSTSINGGWLNRNWGQLYKQIAYVAAVVAYTFVMTALIAKVFDMIPILRLRADEEAEEIGMDDAELGEFIQDFVELRRNFDSWSTPGAEHPHAEGLENQTDHKIIGTNGHLGDINEMNGRTVEHGATNGDGIDAEKQEHPVAAGDRHGVPDRSPHF